MLSRSKEEVPQEGTEVARSSPPPGSPGKTVQAGSKPRLLALEDNSAISNGFE